MKFKEIKGYPGYFITDTGQVFNSKGKELKGWFWNFNGHLRKRVTLSYFKDKIRCRKVVSVARLVAIHFILNPENKPQVNHEDGDTTNDYANNLKWATPLENVQHAIKLGLRTNTIKVKIINKKTNKSIDFDSVSECRRYLNMKQSCNIYQAIKESHRTVKGYYIRKY